MSIRYHQRAVQSLRKRLIEEGGISDEMIGIASGFVVYAVRIYLIWYGEVLLMLMNWYRKSQEI